MHQKKNEEKRYLLTCSVSWEKHEVLSNIECYAPFLLQGRNRIKIEPVTDKDGKWHLQDDLAFESKISDQDDLKWTMDNEGSKYSNNNALGREFLTEIEGEFSANRASTQLTCKHCEKLFKTKSGYQRHIYSNSCTKKSSVSHKKVQHNRYIKNRTNTRHKHAGRKRKLKFSCLDCETSFSSELWLKKHIEQKVCKREFRCHVCEKSFARNDNLKRHFIMTHTDDKMNKKKYEIKCKICKEEFPTYHRLNVHRKTIHVDKIVMFRCEICNKEFLIKSDLNSHSKIHNGIKPHKCDQCGKSFRKISDHTRHMMVHTGEKPFKCEQCGKQVRDQWCLKEHMRSHSDETPFGCHVCTRTYKTKNNLREHLSKIHQL